MAKPQPLPPEPSLDEQIARAEQQVIVRDARIRHRTDVLFRRVRHETIKHAGGGALLGIATVAITWWFNRLARKNAPPPQAAAAHQPEPPPTFEHLFRDAGLTVAGLLPLVWPMLPRTWRRMVTPGTASTLLTFMAPLLGKLFRRKPRQAQTS